MLKVKLIAYTAFPAEVVAAAAKTCYSPRSIDSVMDSLDGEKADDFVRMLSTIGHESPIEHANFTFAVEGVSRSLLAQLTRHRLASYSVKSQRYVSEREFTYVIPPEIEADEEAKKIFLEAMEQDTIAYNKLADILTERHYQTFLAEGKDEKTAKKDARKKAQEDARYVLPNACDTQLVMTMNARSLKNFFKQRCCERAQWEIRDLAQQMFKLVYEVSPALFEKAGPACVYGPCPEGKMCCGHTAQVRATYDAIKAEAKNG